uniref:Uncharacterized protein n=1 Tax=Sphaerodactylus townsendi TaxID=933632 RepID=A0ACB8EMZ9_9SAUR
MPGDGQRSSGEKGTQDSARGGWHPADLRASGAASQSGAGVQISRRAYLEEGEEEFGKISWGACGLLLPR